MRKNKRLLILIGVLLIGLAIPVSIITFQKVQEYRGKAAGNAAVCTSLPATQKYTSQAFSVCDNEIQVSKVTETYDEAGVYIISFTVKNNTSEKRTIKFNNGRCHCGEACGFPMSQYGYTGLNWNGCFGDWPKPLPAELPRPTTAPADDSWCEETDLLPLVLNPGQVYTYNITMSVDDAAAYIDDCGNYQLDWIVEEILDGNGQPLKTSAGIERCTNATLNDVPAQNRSAYGLYFTGKECRTAPEETVCSQGRCIEATGPNDNRQACTADLGEIDPACNISVCDKENNLDVCKSVFVEDKNNRKTCTSPADCVTKTVCAVGKCALATASTTNNKLCTTAVGTTDPACNVSVCINENTCSSVPIEQQNGRLTCSSAADCAPVVNRKKCDYTNFTCVNSNEPGMNMCRTAEDCYVNVCVSTQSCEKKSPRDLVAGVDILCTTSADCTVRNVCRSFQCVQERSLGTNECTNDTDCIKTYKTCENLACVEKQGVDKQSTCNLDADCSKKLCNESNQCVVVADTSNSADQCQNNDDCDTTHLACKDMRCAIADGGGADLCTNDAECYRNICNEQDQCAKIADTSRQPDACTSSQDCATPESTHLECVTDSCQEVVGDEANQCSSRDDCVQKVCSKDLACVEIVSTTNEPDKCRFDEDCQSPLVVLNKYKTCETYRCVEKTGIAPVGTQICTVDEDCVAKNYKTCIEESCQEQRGVAPVGAVTCTTDDDCKIATYRTCADYRCVTKVGTPPAQTQLCTSDQDCAAPVPESTYKTCLNETCVTLRGTPAPGVQICTTDSDCVPVVPPVLEPNGTAGVAVLVGIMTMVLIGIGIRLLF